ncbi:hypothetical protein HanPSC8_Chr11g0455091 [Helianthus annuus]|nr:hypothetical protein HanPSC8_Chr11g0455091 [Helianthus annuus]
MKLTLPLDYSQSVNNLLTILTEMRFIFQILACILDFVDSYFICFFSDLRSRLVDVLSSYVLYLYVGCMYIYRVSYSLLCLKLNGLKTHAKCLMKCFNKIDFYYPFFYNITGFLVVQYFKLSQLSMFFLNFISKWLKRFVTICSIFQSYLTICFRWS